MKNTSDGSASAPSASCWFSVDLERSYDCVASWSAQMLVFRQPWKLAATEFALRRYWPGWVQPGPPITIDILALQCLDIPRSGTADTIRTPADMTTLLGSGAITPGSIRKTCGGTRPAPIRHWSLPILSEIPRLSIHSSIDGPHTSEESKLTFAQPSGKACLLFGNCCFYLVPCC